MNNIPDSIMVNTGEQEYITKIIDDFFIETRDYVLKKYDLENFSFEIHSELIGSTDNVINYLSYKDRPLATVLETRNQSNYVNYTFFRNLEGLEDLISKT